MSLKSNLYWGPGNPGGTGTGDTTLVVWQTDGASQPFVDLMPPAAIGTTRSTRLTGLHQSALYTNQGHGYAENLSRAVGLADVFLDSSGGPQFKNVNAGDVNWNALASWDASLGGPGTEAHAQARSSPCATGYTLAAWLTYIRDAYRPTNAALANATYPGDATTTDAAGNALAGTIGAMAYQSPDAPGLNLTGPSTTTVKSLGHDGTDNQGGGLSPSVGVQAVEPLPRRVVGFPVATRSGQVQGRLSQAGLKPRDGREMTGYSMTRRRRALLEMKRRGPEIEAASVAIAEPVKKIARQRHSLGSPALPRRPRTPLPLAI